uniref:CBM21 domain-containing protein n=1 Tax=Acrobeloides nanus TaxID=290746 RepID=A0A914CSM0_9BILA
MLQSQTLMKKIDRKAQNLEAQKVALENCIVKNEECKMIGTIKVANITNEKLVNVRVTFDEWKTFQDLPATYQTSPSKNYDNFFFKLEIPSIQAERIEFCISYHANGTEYWDSNNGINYSLIRHNNDCV